MRTNFLPEILKDFLEEVGTDNNIKIDLDSDRGKLDLFGSLEAQ